MLRDGLPGTGLAGDELRPQTAVEEGWVVGGPEVGDASSEVRNRSELFSVTSPLICYDVSHCRAQLTSLVSGFC
jgi:hypothetical protein